MQEPSFTAVALVILKETVALRFVVPSCGFDVGDLLCIAACVPLAWPSLGRSLIFVVRLLTFDHDALRGVVSRDKKKQRNRIVI